MKSMMLKDITFKTTSEQAGVNVGSSVSPAVLKEDGPQYPYGLMLCLDAEVVKALGIEDAVVGKKMKMEAMVEVCSVNMSESKEYGKKVYVNLQIVEMELEKEKADPVKKLYEDSDKY
jgi:hypothetical protein